MEMLTYIGKVSLYWTLFYICYLLLLRQHTFFRWNRIYLISSLIISFALPFMIYPASAPVIPAIYEVKASSVTIAAIRPETSFLPLAELLWLMYILGALFISYQFFMNLRQLNGFLRQGELIELEDCKVVLINSNNIGSFSFMKWIVVNRNDYDHHFDAILRHEMVHMQQKHSWDVLLVEILKIIFWFNPILILYKKSLQEIHEFLADAQAPNREHYATFLVSYALHAPVASLTNHFFKPSQIKTRIKMIYKNRTSKWMLSTYVLVFVTISAVALIMAGCEQNEGEDFTKLDQTFKAKDAIGKSFEAGKIFTVVEQQPEFPGGNEEMYKFLGENIKYPEAASRAQVSGRVFLSFVVSEKGEISDVLVLKGIGFGCDEEAVRVLRSFPKWKPGKQDGVAVRVRYNLPIHFQIKSEIGSAEKMKNTKPAVFTETNLPNVSVGSDVAVGASHIQLRWDGQNPNATSEPLYLLDGKVDEEGALLKKINPDSIESISVLKGEAATTTYGFKGRNGVVLIQTKKK